MPRVLKNALDEYSCECAQDSRIRELDYRGSDGNRTQLLWHPADDLVWLSADDGTAKRFEFPVPGNDTMFDFNQPFAYAN